MEGMEAIGGKILEANGTVFDSIGETSSCHGKK